MLEELIRKYCTKGWVEFYDFKKEEVNLSSKEILVHSGDKVKGIYKINTGKMKIDLQETKDSSRLIRLISSGDIVGHRGFGGDWKYSITATALEDTNLTFIDLETFDAIAKSNAEFSYHLMMFFAEELKSSENSFLHLPVRFRILKTLLANYEAFGKKDKNSGVLSYTISRKEIANMAMTTYETVVRVLANLNKVNLIEIKGKEIFIPDLKKFKEEAMKVDLEA